MTRKQDVVLDTSVLINFAKVERLDLLAAHPLYSFVVTDHVRGEVSEHYEEQFEAVDSAIQQGILKELVLPKSDVEL